MEEKIFLARIAEQGERYDEMSDFVHAILKEKKEHEGFTPDERTLVATGFKHVVD